MQRIQEFLRITGARSLYVYSLIIGAFSGLAALAFSYALALAEHVILHGLAGLTLAHPAGDFHFEPFRFSGPNLWLLLFLPALGGLVSGLISHLFCPQARGTGTNALIEAFHQGEGRFPGRVPLAKSLATIATLATGGSAGKEGPTAQIGAGLGSFVARISGAGARARRTLLLAGAAGGLGAIFRAPLGGAITAIEVLYKEDFETDALIPCIISSVTGYLVYTSVAGSGSVFSVGKVGMGSYLEIGLYFALAGSCFLAGQLFIYLFKKTENFFERLRLPAWIKPALGASCVGVVGLAFPEVMGTGAGFLQELLDGRPMTHPFFHPALFFAGIALLKIGTTVLTVGSGGSGGVFGPSLFIGAMLGAFVASFASTLFPELPINRSAFLLVGMGGFFSGVAHAPIAGMLMVCDMAGTYALLPALMITSILAIIFSGKGSIYSGQVKNKFQSPAHLWDMNFDVLETLRIRDFLPDHFLAHTMPEKTTLKVALKEVEAQGLGDLIVTDASGEYSGLVFFKEIHGKDRILKQKQPLGKCARKIPPLSVDDTLATALKELLGHHCDAVAIVSSGQPVGCVRYPDIFQIYQNNRRRA
ncbi:MAG: chloride channel protein [Spirochaetales bacterium]|nr:chloride channel protein [Spirochaetales bacterium]